MNVCAENMMTKWRMMFVLCLGIILALTTTKTFAVKDTCPRDDFIIMHPGNTCLDIGPLCNGLTITVRGSLRGCDTNTEETINLQLKTEDGDVTMALTYGTIPGRYTEITLSSGSGDSGSHGSASRDSVTLTDLVTILERKEEFAFGVVMKEDDGMATVQIAHENQCFGMIKLGAGFSLGKTKMCGWGSCGEIWNAKLSKTGACERVTNIQEPCYQPGVIGSYTGRVNVTETGRSCQRWAEDSPHVPKLRPSEDDPKNYCRFLSSNRPWCYTTDPHKRWEYCDIPICDVPSYSDCYRAGVSGSYSGIVSETETGLVCQRWASTTPHKPRDKFMTLPDNHCRVAGETRPWCYTLDPGKKWEHCAVPECEVSTEPMTDTTVGGGSGGGGEMVTQSVIDNSTPGAEVPYMVKGYALVVMGDNPIESQRCYHPGVIGSYTGRVNVTEKGRSCQRWAEDSPHKPYHRPSEADPNNYCRFLTTNRPWCYTVDPDKRWEYCDIPSCNGREIGIVTPEVTPEMRPKVTPKATQPAASIDCPRIDFIPKISGEQCMDIGQLCEGLTISPYVTLSNINTDQNFKLTLKSADEILLTLTLTFGGTPDRYTDIVVTSPKEKVTHFNDWVEVLERAAGIPFGFSVTQTEGKPTIQIMNMNNCTKNKMTFAVGFSLDKRYDMCASGYGTTSETKLSKTEECFPFIVPHLEHDGSLAELFDGYTGDVDDYENKNTGPEPDNGNTSGSQDRKKIGSSQHRDIMVTVTTVGLSMSLLCLLLTVIVQIGTGKVKKTPGKLIVSLATSLFIAQLLFLVKDQPGLSIATGANTLDLGGVADVNDALDHDAPDVNDAPDRDAAARGESAEPVTAPDLSDTPDLSSIPVLRELPCTIVAVTQHLAWLYTFSWSNTMVIDMFRAISSHSSVYRRGHTNTYPFYLLTASVAPCAIVATCLTLNFQFQFEWVRYGKPGDCWIQYRSAQVYFFAVPIAVNVLVNIALLVMVFVVIHKMREETSSLGRDAVLTHRRSAIIGLKLASVMGLTWIFGFLGSLLGNDVLLYMFTVINSLQGVYVFFGLSYDHSAVKRWMAEKLGNE